MDIKTLIRCLHILPTDQAVLIRGDHGIGKSQIVKGLAKAQGKELIDVRASTMSEGDVVGYPNLDLIKETGVASFALPSWYVRACQEGVVLFLDELNRGLMGVLNGFFQIVLDRELGSGPDGKPMRLHPDTQVIAAVNSGADYTVNEMDPALLSRFWVQDLKPSVDDWIGWAREKGVISSTMIDFILQNPAHLRPTRSVEVGKVAPNQRSWEMLNSALINAGIKLDELENGCPDIVYPLATGFVGFEAASAFVDFVKNSSLMLTAGDILDGWSPSIKKKATSLSTEKVLSLIEKIKTHSTKNEWTLTQVENLTSFFGLLTGEQKMNLYNSILSSGSTPNVTKFHAKVRAEVMTIVRAAQDVSTKKN